MGCCCDNDTNTVDSSTLSPASETKGSRTNCRPDSIVPWIRWAIPITTLALVPKCPACLATYVLMFTGMGLSFSAAATIRWALIAACVVTLACLVLRAVRHSRSASRIRRAVEAR